MQQVDVHALAGRSRFNGFHGLVLFWCVLILIIDGYDLAVVGAALPSIMKDMGVDATSAGVMAGSALLGTMLGAIFLGTLADRIGRPRMIAVCVALFSLFTAAAGLTNDPISFSVARFIAGLGIGGVLPIVTAQMGEFAPSNLRTRLVTLVFAGYSVGGILVALTAKQLIEGYGWQWVFYVAGLPVLLIPLILKTMPESLSFLVKKGDQRQLRAMAARIAPEQLHAVDAIYGGSPTDKVRAAPIRSLFEEGRGLSTVMIWVAFMTGLFMVYALNSWLTKLMAMAGYSLGSALNFVIVFNVGAIVGAIGGGLLSDKFNIKHCSDLLLCRRCHIADRTRLYEVDRAAVPGRVHRWCFHVGHATPGLCIRRRFLFARDTATGVGFASGVGRIGAIVAPV